jgi:hypothetical protein
VISAVSRMTNSSIYFHVLEARRRNAPGLDDFSVWLEGCEGDWSHYIQAIRSIDVTFFTVPEIKKKLIELLRAASRTDERGERL